MKIYLDNAASTPLDPEVLDHMLPFLAENFGNPSAVHHHGRVLRNAIEQSRKTIAEMVGAAPGEIFFTSGGTEADNMAIHCTVIGHGIKHIITTPIEHHAVSHAAERCEKMGRVQVHYLDVSPSGIPDYNQLEELLKTHQDVLVTLMHANNEIGTITDINLVAKLCNEHGAYFHSDTVQTMGTELHNFEESGLHFAAASAHKFYGPKGIGFLYMRSGMKIPSLLAGGGQERNVRAGTENISGIVGMAFALEKCIKNLEEKNTKLWELKNYMKASLLEAFPNVSFNGETEMGKSIPTVLNTVFNSPDKDLMLLFNLDIKGISVSGGSACTSGSVKGSHVLSGIGCAPELAANAVRFSFGVPNSKADIDYTLEVLKEIVPIPVST